MTAVSGKCETVSTARSLQVLQLAIGIISAVLQSVLIIIKSMYQLVRPQPAKSLVGEVALVTGAGHGIGHQLALEFWDQGCTVICVDIDDGRNQFTVRDINTRHRHRLEASSTPIREGWEPAHAYTCDVMDRNQVAELAQRVSKDLGPVDILVNNAGIMTVQPIQQVDASEVVDEVNVNLLSHFWMLLAFLPGMMERNHGHVVAISSVAGLCDLADKVPYSASKYAVTGLMDALSEELRLDSHNIKLTCAHPYFVRTRSDLQEGLDLRIPELSPELSAREIVSAVRHDRDAVIVPRNLLFWLNVLRRLPQDAREVWRDLFHSRVSPTETPSPIPYRSEVPSNGIKT